MNVVPEWGKLSRMDRQTDRSRSVLTPNCGAETSSSRRRCCQSHEGARRQRQAVHGITPLSVQLSLLWSAAPPNALSLFCCSRLSLLVLGVRTAPSSALTSTPGSLTPVENPLVSRVPAALASGKERKRRATGRAGLVGLRSLLLQSCFAPVWRRAAWRSWPGWPGARQTQRQRRPAVTACSPSTGSQAPKARFRVVGLRLPIPLSLLPPPRTALSSLLARVGYQRQKRTAAPAQGAAGPLTAHKRPPQCPFLPNVPAPQTTTRSNSRRPLPSQIRPPTMRRPYGAAHSQRGPPASVGH